MKKAPASVLCSLPELPHDMRGELHPTRPWLLYCIDANPSEGLPASVVIFDYASRNAVRTITSDPELPSTDVSPALSPAVSPHLPPMPEPLQYAQQPPQSPQHQFLSPRTVPGQSPQASPARLSRPSISISSAVPLTPPRAINVRCHTSVSSLKFRFFTLVLCCLFVTEKRSSEGCWINQDGTLLRRRCSCMEGLRQSAKFILPNSRNSVTRCIKKRATLNGCMQHIGRSCL